jgi:hypothetical protein
LVTRRIFFSTSANNFGIFSLLDQEKNKNIKFLLASLKTPVQKIGLKAASYFCSDFRFH